MKVGDCRLKAEETGLRQWRFIRAFQIEDVKLQISNFSTVVGLSHCPMTIQVKGFGSWVNDRTDDQCRMTNDQRLSRNVQFSTSNFQLALFPH